jgi:hypothetical protein
MAFKSASQLAHGDARAVSVVSEAAAGQSQRVHAGWYDCLPPRRRARWSSRRSVQVCLPWAETVGKISMQAAC